MSLAVKLNADSRFSIHSIGQLITGDDLEGSLPAIVSNILELIQEVERDALASFEGPRSQESLALVRTFLNRGKPLVDRALNSNLGKQTVSPDSSGRIDEEFETLAAGINWVLLAEGVSDILWNIQDEKERALESLGGENRNVRRLYKSGIKMLDRAFSLIQRAASKTDLNQATEILGQASVLMEQSEVRLHEDTLDDKFVWGISINWLDGVKLLALGGLVAYFFIR